MVRFFLPLNCCFFYFLIFPFFLYATTSESEIGVTKYISDLVVINLKTSVKAPYSPTTTVYSGDPVIILKEQGNFYKVETTKGITGWVSKNYLKDETPKPIIIKQLQDELSDLKAQLGSNATTVPVCPPCNNEINIPERPGDCQELEFDITELQAEIARLSEQNTELLNSNYDLQKQKTFSPSAEAFTNLEQEASLTKNQLEQTTKKYSVLVTEFENRGEEIAVLQTTIAKHNDKTRFYWFGAGAIVFFVGLLAGKSGRRKKSKFMY